MTPDGIGCNLLFAKCKILWWPEDDTGKHTLSSPGSLIPGGIPCLAGPPDDQVVAVRDAVRISGHETG